MQFIRFWLPLTACLLLLQIHHAWPLLAARLATAFWWPVAASALLSFAIILLRLRRGLKPALVPVCLLVLSAAVTAAALLRSSLWLHLPAMWLTVTALAASGQSTRPAPRLFVLTLPWLLLAAAPPRICNLLFELLASAISQQYILSQGSHGQLAWTAQASLHNAAGTCSITALLLSPFGTPLLLAGCSLLSIHRRLSLVQTLLLIVPGVAGCLPLTAAILWLAMVFPQHLTTPAGDPTWLCWTIQTALTTAWLLLWKSSTMTLTASITSPADAVPDSINPWVLVWDHIVAGQTLPHSAANTELGLPNLLTAARSNLTPAAIIDALWTWWYSRSWIRSCLALLLVTSISTLPFLTHGEATRQLALKRTQATADAAKLAGQQQIHEQALRMLISLQPAYGPPRLELVEILCNTGRPEESRDLLTPLVGSSPHAWGPARLWLVKNSLQQAPLIPLSDEDRVRELRLLLDESPGNSEAASLLAKFYLAAGESLLAEKVLSDSVSANSANAPLLLDFCNALNRPVPDPDRFQLLLQKTSSTFRNTPASQRSSRQCLELAELLLALGRIDEACAVVSDVRKTADSPELQQFEAASRLRRITQTSTREFISPQPILDDLEFALGLAPDSAPALELATLLTIIEGARLSPTTLEALMQHTNAQSPDSNASGRAATIELLKGNWSAAAAGLQRLRQMQPLQPAQQMALVFALRQDNRKDEADREADTAIARIAAQPSPDTVRQALLLQIATGTIKWPKQLTLPPESPEFQLGSALLSQFRFDQLTRYPGDLSPEIATWHLPTNLQPAEALQLLEIPLRNPNTQAAVARRLYRLRRTSGKYQPTVDNWLQQTRATLGDSGKIMLIVGTMAVLDEAWDEAIYWLDTANRTLPAPSPVALNNLAIAIVRAPRKERFPEALKLITSALSLIPDNPDLLASRGEIQMSLNNWNAAYQDLQQALRLQPEQPDAIRLLPVVEAQLQGH